MLTNFANASSADVAAGAATGGILAALAGLWIFMVVVGLVFFVLWLLMLLHALRMEESDFQKVGVGEKNVWLIILIASFFVGFSWLAAIVYYFAIYLKAKKVVGK